MHVNGHSNHSSHVPPAHGFRRKLENDESFRQKMEAIGHPLLNNGASETEESELTVDPGPNIPVTDPEPSDTANNLDLVA